MGSYAASLERRVATLKRHVMRLERRLAASVAFARSTAPPDDSGNVQTIQGRLDALSTRDGMPMLVHYGFSSAMPIGGDKVVPFGNGERSSGVVIAGGHQQYRQKGLQTGEVCLYDMWGHAGGFATVRSGTAEPRAGRLSRDPIWPNGKTSRQHA